MLLDRRCPPSTSSHFQWDPLMILGDHEDRCMTLNGRWEKSTKGCFPLKSLHLDSVCCWGSQLKPDGHKMGDTDVTEARLRGSQAGSSGNHKPKRNVARWRKQHLLNDYQRTGDSVSGNLASLSLQQFQFTLEIGITSGPGLNWSEPQRRNQRQLQFPSLSHGWFCLWSR